MESWRLTEIPSPNGTRTPHVLSSEQGAARAVLIEFAPGQELGEHEVREHAWVSVVRGRVTITAGEDTVEGSAGTLVHLRPGERHALRSSQGARVLLLLAPWPAADHYVVEGATDRGRRRSSTAMAMPPD